MAEKDTKSTTKAKSANKTDSESTKTTATKKSATKGALKSEIESNETKANSKSTKTTSAKKSATKDATQSESKSTSAKSKAKSAKESDKSERLVADDTPKSKSSKSTRSSGVGVAAMAISPRKLRAVIVSAVSMLLVIIIIVGVVLGTKSCNPSNYNYDRFDDNANFVAMGLDDSNWDGVLSSVLTDGYEKGSSRAPQVSEYLGVMDNVVKPVKGVVDEHETYGVAEYPSYGKNLSGYTVDERNGLIKESHALAPSPTWKSLGIYNGIDSEGYLLKDGKRVPYSSNVGSGEDEEGEGEIISGGIDNEGDDELETGSTTVNKQYVDTYRKLYKHTAALTNYGGGLSDDEPRIVKQLTFISRTKLESSQITGLYAPAGEVIKIEMSKDDYYAIGGFRILIGQTYNLFQHVSMETAGDGIKGTGLCRMPDILSIFELKDANKNVVIDGDKVTAYVGSFLGGPIYFRPINNGLGLERVLSVTISGGVRYQHFILGATTEEEYNANKASTAPYFDLEVYDGAVRFTTHKYAASGGKALKDYTYEDCTDAAILWDKISQVSKRVQWNGLSAASAPVYIIGDCYMAAGAAFANPGRNGVVCPPGWLAEALNYNNFVNGGSWGTMHEYNHCWQGYGLGNSGEVSNNATTLIAYSLYTRISQSRTMTGGLGGWNRYTDPAWAMQLLLPTTAAGSKIFDLSAYATLLHNIGQDSFIKAARGGKEGGSTVYFNNLVNASHYDMTYFFTKVLNYDIGGEKSNIGSITQEAIDAVRGKNYPMFVPVSSVYQVGRSIIYDNEKLYITTAQPFSYGFGEFTMDFNNHNGDGTYTNKNLMIPDGFTVRVASVTQPENGQVKLLENNLVKYTPSNGASGLYSGNFRVKLRITKNDRAFIVEDVDLVINLKQSAGDKLERTTYVYDFAESVPNTASVYNAQTNTFDFGAYATIENKVNVCAQESNTQIWAAGWNYDDDVYIKDSTNYRVQPINQTLQTLGGTLYFSSAGNYRITLKGRGKATLYLSYDNGDSWVNALTIARSSVNAYINTEYTEHTFTATNNYVQFKVVLLVTNISDFFGIGVAKQNAAGTYPNFSNASAIVNADVHKALVEESAKKFETEYRYKSEYKYTYSSEEICYAYTNKLISVNYDAWDANQRIENMFDGDVTTAYHSKQNDFINENKPFELIVDLGSLRRLNSITFYGYNDRNGNKGMPVTFKLYGSKEKESGYELLIEKTDMPSPTRNITLGFDEAEIRYYKLIVTKTDNGRYFSMNRIVFSYTIAYSNGMVVAPNDSCIRYIGNSWMTENVLCNFGLAYSANAGDSVEFHFIGTRFAYFACPSAEFGTVDIYLDGKQISSNLGLSSNNSSGPANVQITDAIKNYYGETIAKIEGSLAYMYDGAALAKGEHVVTIVGKRGKFNVDSFVYWN